MLETGLVGVASYSARGKQYIVSLRPFHEGLILHQLRYAQEVKPWSEVPLPELPELKPAEIGLAKQIIQQIAHETFSPEKYKDEVQERMMELINQKVEGQEITVAPEAPAGKVIDLMEALKASLGMAKADDRKGAVAAEAKTEAAPEEEGRVEEEVSGRSPPRATSCRSRGRLAARLIEGDDGALWVTKFRGAGQGMPALVAEAIAGELARAASCRSPSSCARDPARFGLTDGDPEIHDLLVASEGDNLGSHS